MVVRFTVNEYGAIWTAESAECLMFMVLDDQMGERSADHHCEGIYRLVLVRASFCLRSTNIQNVTASTQSTKRHLGVFPRTTINCPHLRLNPELVRRKRLRVCQRAFRFAVRIN